MLEFLFWNDIAICLVNSQNCSHFWSFILLFTNYCIGHITNFFQKLHSTWHSYGIMRTIYKYKIQLYIWDSIYFAKYQHAVLLLLNLWKLFIDRQRLMYGRNQAILSETEKLPLFAITLFIMWSGWEHSRCHIFLKKINSYIFFVFWYIFFNFLKVIWLKTPILFLIDKKYPIPSRVKSLSDGCSVIGRSRWFPTNQSVLEKA